MTGLDSLGAVTVSDGEIGYVDAIFKAAGGLIQGGVNIAEQHKAEKQTTAEAASKLENATKADLITANAVAKAEVSKKFKLPSAEADKSRAQKAVAIQTKAGAGLSAEGQQKRLEVAEKMLATTTAAAKKKPDDETAGATAKTWQALVEKLRAPAEAPKAAADEESWLTRPVVGKVPGYFVVGGVALLGVVGLVIRKVFSH